MSPKYAAALLAVMISSQAAANGFESGQDLHTKLADRERGDINYNAITGAGYVIGVADSFDEDLFCIPVGVSKGQVIQVAKNHLAAHPELWNKTAASLVIGALVRAWPCPQPRK